MRPHKEEDEGATRKSKFSESQIVAILKEGESGLAVAEVCRQHGIRAATYYAWKSKYAASR
jgi:putative transposase